MSRLLRTRRYRWLNFVAVLGLILAMSLPSPASADTQGNGSINVTATNAAKLTISIDDNSAVFGTGLDPEGTAATGGENVTDVQGSTGNQGSYYIWQASTGSGQSVTVKSNKVWTSNIQASENAGTASNLTVASGALRFCTAVPASYSAAGTDCTAFSTSIITPTASPDWDSVAKGTNTYSFYYVLRVDWDTDPGTFTSAITYTASQQ